MKKLLFLIILSISLHWTLSAQVLPHRYWITGQDTIVKGFDYKYKFSTTQGLHFSTTIKWNHSEGTENSDIKVSPDPSTGGTLPPSPPRGIILNIADTTIFSKIRGNRNYDYLEIYSSAGFLKDAEKKIVVDREFVIHPNIPRPYCSDTTTYYLKYIPNDVVITWECPTNNMVLISEQGKHYATFYPIINNNDNYTPGIITATIRQGDIVKIAKKEKISLPREPSEPREPVVPREPTNPPSSNRPKTYIENTSSFSVKIFSFPSNIIIYQKNNITDFNIEDANLKTGNIYIIHKTYKDGTTSSEKIIKK